MRPNLARLITQGRAQWAVTWLGRGVCFARAPPSGCWRLLRGAWHGLCHLAAVIRRTPTVASLPVGPTLPCVCLPPANGGLRACRRVTGRDGKTIGGWQRLLCDKGTVLCPIWLAWKFFCMLTMHWFLVPLWPIFCENTVRNLSFFYEVTFRKQTVAIKCLYIVCIYSTTVCKWHHVHDAMYFVIMNE